MDKKYAAELIFTIYEGALNANKCCWYNMRLTLTWKWPKWDQTKQWLCHVLHYHTVCWPFHGDSFLHYICQDPFSSKIYMILNNFSKQKKNGLFLCMFSLLRCRDTEGTYWYVHASVVTIMDLSVVAFVQEHIAYHNVPLSANTVPHWQHKGSALPHSHNNPLALGHCDTDPQEKPLFFPDLSLLCVHGLFTNLF